MSLGRRIECGSASIVALGIVLAAAFLLAVLAAVGSSYVAHAELQQAADIAAVVIERGAGDAPRVRAESLARANGARRVRIDERAGRIRIRVEGRAPAAFGMRRGARIHAVAYADEARAATIGDGGPNPPGIYSGPLVQVAAGVTVCPAVARAYEAMAAAARRDGVTLAPTSGFRGWQEQAALFARLGPGLAAPPGTSRHHDATELDISVGPAGSPTHSWLQGHGGGFGWRQRYGWEPWHWGYVAGC